MADIKAKIRKVKQVVNTSDLEYYCENPEEKRSKAFQRAYRNLVKAIFPESEGYTVENFNGAYCEASGFIQKSGKYVYLNSGDYRFITPGAIIHPIPYLDDILIRTAQHNKDYHGGRNNYSSIYKLKEDVDKLLEE